MTDEALPMLHLPDPPPLPDLPPGYFARTPVEGDAPALAALLAAHEIAESGSSDMTVEDFVGDWAGVDLNTDTILIEGLDGAPAAYADVDAHANVAYAVYGYVHPEQNGRGLGSYLVSWGERRALRDIADAPEGARVHTQHYIYRGNDAARALLEAHGYDLARATHVMGIDLTEPPPSPQWPGGIEVRTFVRGEDEQATHDAVEDAFRDMWERPPGTFAKFMARLERGYFDPDLWFLAMEGEQVAATVLTSEIDGKGWIETAGVRRPWRGRGLGLAMLRHAFAAFWARGVTEIGLSVDAESPTGAGRLYERAGMHVDKVYLLYRKILRPGYIVTADSGEG